VLQERFDESALVVGVRDRCGERGFEIVIVGDVNAAIATARLTHFVEECALLSWKSSAHVVGKEISLAAPCAGSVGWPAPVHPTCCGAPALPGAARSTQCKSARYSAQQSSLLSMPQWSVTVYPLAGAASSAVARLRHHHPHQPVIGVHQKIGDLLQHPFRQAISLMIPSKMEPAREQITSARWPADRRKCSGERESAVR